MRRERAAHRRRLRAALCCAALAIGGTPAAAEETGEAALRERAEQVLNLVRQRVADCSGGPTLVALAATEGATASDASAAERPALRWNDRLAEAAARHAGAMARTRVFAHVGADGTTVRERVDATGYRWLAVAENLAAGQDDFAQAVADWLASTSHCGSLVDARYTEFGIARSRAVHPFDTYGTYWALVLGRPR